MKRTLLAVGVAVLLSMMLIPTGESGVQMWLPWFFSVHWLPGWAGYWRIQWHEFILQTVFVSVLAAVLVNLWPRKPRK